MSKTRAEAVASLLLALACLLAPVRSVGAGQEAAAEWVRYTFQREEFSVLLPAEPFVRDVRRRIPGTMFETEAGRVFGVYADGVVYTITSYDNPRPVETLDYFVDYHRLREPKDAQTRELASDTFRGWELSRSYACGGGHGTCEGVNRVFRTDRHAYVVRAVGEGGTQAAIKKFFDSFTLSAKPAGRSISDKPPTLPPYRMSQPDEPKPQATPAPSPSPDGVNRGPLLTREVTRKAVIVFKPEPGYTEKARKNDVEGVVRLKMVLGADGRVSDIVLVKKLPDGLTERALLAAQHILFIPAQKDGRRVSQWITVEYSFNIY